MKWRKYWLCFQFQIYERYLEEHVFVLEELNLLFTSNLKFETLYREFESQKVCHLPVTTFILKPLQRLLHYSRILDSKKLLPSSSNFNYSFWYSSVHVLGLLKYYGKNHPHYEDCYQAKTTLLNVAKPIPKILRKSVRQWICWVSRASLAFIFLLKNILFSRKIWYCYTN